MERVVRTAISLPSEDFASLESARKRLNKTRNEVMREALQSWLRRRNIAALEKKYVEGYRRIPEDPFETSPHFAKDIKHRTSKIENGFPRIFDFRLLRPVQRVSILDVYDPTGR